MDAELLVKAYVRIRDAKEAKAKQLKEEIAELDTQLDMIEGKLLDLCKTTGQDGGKTSAGSFTRTVKTRYWPSDWSTVYALINEMQLPELLEQRIHQGNFQRFIAEHPDRLPAGMNTDSKYSILVRRSK